MRLPLLVCLALVTAGCTNSDSSDGGTDAPDGTGANDAGGNATHEMEVAAGRLTLGPQQSSVIPGSNASVSLPITLNESYETLRINATVTTGTSVNLRFALGDCTMTVPPPVTPGRTYTKECENVPAGAYNLTFRHDSGSATVDVKVVGIGASGATHENATALRAR